MIPALGPQLFLAAKPLLQVGASECRTFLIALLFTGCALLGTVPVLKSQPSEEAE